MIIKIEKNIPLPTKHNVNDHSLLFQRMKIGDSFYLPKTKGRESEIDRSLVLKRANKYALKSNKNFKVTTKIDSKGLLCWCSYRILAVSRGQRGYSFKC